MKSSLFPLILSFLMLQEVCAQAPDFAWERHSNSLANPDVEPSINTTATVVDTINHYIYTLGAFSGGGIDFGTGELPGNAGSRNLYLTKYDLNGNLSWAKTFFCNSDNFPGGMALDNAGNLIIAGYSIADTVRFGSSYLVNGNPGVNMAYLAKLNSSGNTIWLKGNDLGGGELRCTAVATDANGNIFATGMIDNPAGSFFGNPLTYYGIFIIKVNPAGISQWFKQGSTTNSAQGFAVVADKNNDCIVAGGHSDPFTLDGVNFGFNVGSTYYDRFVTKINGTTGTCTWGQVDGIWQGPDLNYNISTDKTGNIYLSGRENIAPDPMVTTCYEYFFIEKRNALGMIQWHNGYNSIATSPTAPTAIADHVTDPSGNTYVLFQVNDTTVIGNDTIFSSPSYYTSGVLATTAFFDNAGSCQWTRATAETGFLDFTRGAAIALDEGENAYIGGSMYNSAVFGSFTANTNPGSTEAFVTKIGNNALGISETTEELGLLVYPNPAHDRLYISSRKPIQNIWIRDIGGREVYNGKQQSIDLGAFNSGIYVVTVQSKNDMKSIKFTVAR